MHAAVSWRQTLRVIGICKGGFQQRAELNLGAGHDIGGFCGQRKVMMIMNKQSLIRSLAMAILCVGLVASNVVSTQAAIPLLSPTPATPQGLGATGIGGVSDPVVPIATQAQLEDHARRLDAYKAYVLQHAVNLSTINPDGDPGNYGGTAGTANVGNYVEPNDQAHANECGPSSSRVVISNWTSNVPSIDTVAAQEGGTGFTLLSNMVGPINSDGHTNNYYVNQVAGSQGTFNNWLGADVTLGHPIITALETIYGGYTLNGWGHQGAHIVAVYGYNFKTPGAGTISYMEPAGTVAGTTAQGRNTYSTDPFWVLVQGNNGQIW